MKICLVLLSVLGVSCQALERGAEGHQTAWISAPGEVVVKTGEEILDWLRGGERTSDSPMPGPRNSDSPVPNRPSAETPIEIHRGPRDRDGAQRVQVRLAGMVQHAEGQTEPEWCWAACARMIHAYYGTQITQEELARNLHGRERDGSLKVAAATRYELMLALNPDVPRHEFERIWRGLGPQLAAKAVGGDSVELSLNAGAVGSAVLDGLWPSRSIPTQELERGQPAVLALRDAEDPSIGHIYLLCGADYTDGTLVAMLRGTVLSIADQILADERTREAAKSVAGRAEEYQQTIHSLWLYDPADGTFAHHEFDALKPRLDFVLTADQARQTLVQWQNFTQVAQR